MVMGMPTPREISMVFVKQYYTLLNESPEHVHRFYSHDSSFVHGGLERGKKSETKAAQGQKEINERIKKLQFKDARTKIKQVDAHPTLSGGVVIQVSGQMSNNAAPMRPFMQTFVLAPQSPYNYYVYNDIFRYQDDLFSDDEDAGDGAAEADDEAEPESPPAPQTIQPPAAPAPAQAPPAAQPAAAAAAPEPPIYPQTQPPHVNGHTTPSQIAEPAVASPAVSPEPAAAAPAAAAAAVEPEPSPEASPTPRQPSPPPPPPREPSPPPVSNEPKTYANLFKPSSAHKPKPVEKEASPALRSPAVAAAAAASPAAGGGAESGAPPRGPPAARPAPAAGAEPSESGSAAGEPERRRPLVIHPDSHQIFVGNLPSDVQEEELVQHFSPYGTVVEVKIHSSKPAISKGANPGRTYPYYGFVIFESAESVHKVLNERPMMLSRSDGDHRLNIEQKQQRPPGAGRGFSRGGPPRGRGEGRGFGRGDRGGRGERGRGGPYQGGPRR